MTDAGQKEVSNLQGAFGDRKMDAAFWGHNLATKMGLSKTCEVYRFDWMTLVSQGHNLLCAAVIIQDPCTSVEFTLWKEAFTALRLQFEVGLVLDTVKLRNCLHRRLAVERGVCVFVCACVRVYGCVCVQ